MDKKILSLPILSGEATPPDARWQGLRAIDAPPLDLSPEPQEPQGAYGPGQPEAPAGDAISATAASAHPVELLAPAGGLDAAYAAFHFGADAIYLGLKKFSARAEAENFTLDELDEITAFAHHRTPKGRVFVTVNTLIRQDELGELIEALTVLTEIGVDAVILQDLGVYRAIRRYFPTLELHGSTQMAVHNGAGARALQRLGFARVVLARELTFEEVRDITAAAGIETEVFIHGALCYAYSGLCLFSAQTLGRSGNRGKCAYSCRDTFAVTGAPTTLRDGSAVRRDPGSGFPFSMKDLALPDHLSTLRAAGVSCFKIEGRKKSPLYVATTTDYYRRLIDGTLEKGDRAAVEADLQTVFSRPWTQLFLHSHTDKEVADRDTVGHRGAPVGNVQAVVAGREPRLRFQTRRPLQKHDGLQIDLPVLGKPFGFAVEKLWLIGTGHSAGREAFEAPAEAVVEVSLPREHPAIPIGAPVYCSSSQVVKQRYRHARAKPGLWRRARPLHIEATLDNAELTVGGWTEQVPGQGRSVEASCSVAVAFQAARDVAAMENAACACFARLGDSGFELASLDWKNAGGGFVPASTLNRVRRELVAALTATLQNAHERRVADVLKEVLPPPKQVARPMPFRWSIKVDRVDFLQAFDASDWRDVDEVIIDIARDHPGRLREKIEQLGAQIGRDRIRLALPALTRQWERRGTAQKIAALRADGWTKWEAANLSAWDDLGIDPSDPATDLDIATDWSIYVINRLAAEQVLAMGATRFALSPEDGLANWRTLLGEYGARAVLIVYQDTPLFVAESCAYANLIGGCPGKANCKFESMQMESSHGEQVTALDYHCRTIVLNQGPFCLAGKLPELAKAGAVSLRADFIYRSYDATEVREKWRMIRSGHAIAGSHAANYDRGIL